MAAAAAAAAAMTATVCKHGAFCWMPCCPCLHLGDARALVVQAMATYWADQATQIHAIATSGDGTAEIQDFEGKPAGLLVKASDTIDNETTENQDFEGKPSGLHVKASDTIDNEKTKNQDFVGKPSSLHVKASDTFDNEKTKNQGFEGRPTGLHVKASDTVDNEKTTNQDFVGKPSGLHVKASDTIHNEKKKMTQDLKSELPDLLVKTSDTIGIVKAKDQDFEGKPLGLPVKVSDAIGNEGIQDAEVEPHDPLVEASDVLFDGMSPDQFMKYVWKKGHCISEDTLWDLIDAAAPAEGCLPLRTVLAIEAKIKLQSEKESLKKKLKI